MKKLFLAAACYLLATNLFAQEAKKEEKDGWSKFGTFTLTVNQGSLKNWAAGGEQNTLGVASVLNLTVNHKKGKYNWNNYFDLGLGFQDATSFTRFRKVDDRIDITSKYGYQFHKKWYATLLLNVNTQTLPGYDYSDSLNTKISNFFTPGKILLSAGLDYRPNEQLSIFISPASIKWVFKADKDFYPIDKFGVAAYHKSYSEIGAYATIKYNHSFTKWSAYTGRLDLFSNYKRNPQNVDVLFTNLLTLKFNKWLGSTISLDMIYDDDILKKLQVKEIFGLGITLKI
ncbi:MAG TPA: DUF3078 domain-containing protein [Ferruginibacter sp.]|nr:DUF3078 domain-containing protein [Ferruginibacter sp.]